MSIASQTRRLLGAGALLVTLATALPATAHKATERFIPLGQSPGISHKFTIVGKIEAVDAGRRAVTIATPSETRTVPIGPTSRIWVDRSKLRQTNLNGGFSDLAVGRTIEIRFVNPDRKQVVDWVKVEAPASP
jgi:hypothetical protein